MLPPKLTGALMPRYHSQIRDGRDFPDEHGTILPDLKAARRSAVVAMGEAIEDYSHEFWDHPGWEMQGARRCVASGSLAICSSGRPSRMRV